MKAVEVGSDEWRELRKKYITATDLPVIMGVSKWKKAKDLFLEKTGDVVTFKNASMQRGLDLEPEARKIFENRFSTLLDPEFVVSKEVPWAAASLDGWDRESLMVEIKCSGKEDHNKALSGKVPVHYTPQLQWQLMVTGFDKMFYFSYRPEDTTPTAMISVVRNEEYIKEMLVKAEEFYDLMRNRTLPDRTTTLAPSCENPMNHFTDDYALSLEEELSQILSSRKEGDERIEYIKQELLKMCKGEKTRGRFLRFTPIESKGAIQYEKIPQLQGINVEMYRKPSFLKWRIDQIEGGCNT